LLASIAAVLFQEVRSMKQFVCIAAVLVALALAPTLSAQVQTGSILVRATDEQGAGSPGVAVTISSDVLVGGSTTGVTDVGGIYRFPAPAPRRADDARPAGLTAVRDWQRPLV
jgi:hypothetical protein